jgi:hypothetical protein
MAISAANHARPASNHLPEIASPNAALNGKAQTVKHEGLAHFVRVRAATAEAFPRAIMQIENKFISALTAQHIGRAAVRSAAEQPADPVAEVMAQ